MFLWMTDDHTQGATPGAPTPEYEVARNDHAMGRILEGLTHSAAWDSMAVFVTEDDPQDGQDHVDAHRTIQLVLSPFVKRGYTSAVHHSNLSTLKTMDLLLGVPPNSTQEASATSLGDYFQDTAQPEPRFDALDQQVPFATNPTPAAAANPTLARAAELQASVPAGLDKGGQDLQTVLRLRNEGAAQAGEAGVPVLRDEEEHRLATGSPAAVQLAESPGGPCPLVAPVSQSTTSAAPAALPAGSELPKTGADGLLGLAAACLLLALGLSRLGRSAKV
jgi:hypothetical protein